MDKIEIKKLEILNGLFKSKDSLSWNEVTELLNELIQLSKNYNVMKIKSIEKQLNYENITLINGDTYRRYSDAAWSALSIESEKVYSEYELEKLYQDFIQ